MRSNSGRRCFPTLLWKMLVFWPAAIEGSRAVSSFSRINVNPAAARVFPSAQRSAACEIITIRGLGTLDGDYVLVENPIATQSRPSWVGTSASTENLALSYLLRERVWTIGANDLSVAFLEDDSRMPPAQSSRWQIFNKERSAFEQAGNAVTISCPACSAIYISRLPEALISCEGPYRRQATSDTSGVFIWSHVSDERCTMLHDTLGKSVVAKKNQAASPPEASIETVARRSSSSLNWWAERTGVADTASLGDEASVTCTSAGRTTRLVFDLIESAVPEAIASNRSRFELRSRQDGIIVSSLFSAVHFHILRTKPARRNAINASGAMFHTPEIAADESSLARELRVKTSVYGSVGTSSLEHVSFPGILLTLNNVVGTVVIHICLFEMGVEASNEDCIAETSLILEMFSADTQLVRRRSSREMFPPFRTMAGGLEVEGDGDRQSTHVIFVVGLDSVDGYNLSNINLMRHLPSSFRASTLDLSCASGELPIKDILDKEGLDVFRFCIKLSTTDEVVAYSESMGSTINSSLYFTLADAATWSDVVSEHPDIARALDGLYHHLAHIDVFVMSNGAKDDDAFLLHLARLAGVDVRVVNLGALVGGYMSPSYSGATAIIAPSHYVAHNAEVHRHNVRGLLVKVCHPVMDAARILHAARSCCSCDSGKMGTDACRLQDDKVVAGRGGDPPPARFVMVGRVSPEKTPSVFVRAVAILKRRWEEGLRRGRQTEGVVVGSGPLLEHMKSLSQGLNASIRFAGFLSIDSVTCEVHQATALVLPSTGLETFGMVGPEAMLLGVPVVTFGFGGSGELVRHMENGILVAEPTPRALADALDILVRDPVLRHRLGEQARHDALQALHLPEMIACHADEFATFRRQ